MEDITNFQERIIAEYEKIAFAEPGGEVKVGDKLRALDALWRITQGDSPAHDPADRLVIQTEYV